MNDAPAIPAAVLPPGAPLRPAKRRGVRWRRWLALLLVLGAAAYFLYGKFFGKAAGEARRYETAPVVRRHLRETVSASGTLNPIVSVTVGAEVSGIIRKVLVDYNSSVKAGQAIAQIDTLVYQAALTQAEGDLASAEAALKLAEANLKRKQELRDQKMLAAADYDTAVANVEQARATLQTRQGTSDKAKTDLEHCTIYSPIDGVVTNRAVDLGQTVASSFSTPTMFTIVNDLRHMQIDASVAEADIGGVAVGQPVEFTVDAYPTRTFQGKVRLVHNAPTSAASSASGASSMASATTGVVTYDAVIDVDNAEMKLKPGMTASVSVVIADRKDAVAVPNAALRFTPATASASVSSTQTDAAVLEQTQPSDTHRIYQIKEGGPGAKSGDELSSVEVKTGVTDGAYTEVLSGLKPDDRVVVAKLSGPPSGEGH